MNIFRASARSFLAAPFLIDGYDAIRDPDPHAEKVQRAWSSLEPLGVPEMSASQARWAARLGGVTCMWAATCLAFGKHQRTSATFLAAATLPLAVVNAPVWLAGSKEERRVARKRLTGYGTLFGGLVFASMDRSGKPSFHWKREYDRQQRQAVKALEAQIDAA